MNDNWASGNERNINLSSTSYNAGDFCIETEDHTPLSFYYIPTRDRWTFKGWNESPDGSGSELDASNLHEGTYYAVWADEAAPLIDSITITNNVSATQTLTVSANDSETGIAGYYIGKTDPSMALVSYTNSSSATIDSDGVWYVAVKDGAGNIAVTTRTIQKITLSAGSDATVSPDSLLVEYGSNISLPAATKTGYHASAWSASDGSCSNVSIVYGCRSNLTMTPDWEANQYTVTFDGNGATTGTMARMTMVYDQPKNLSAFAFKKTGATPQKSCWATGKNGDGATYSDKEPVKNLTSVDGGNVTLYANWDDTHYFIAFNGNGATSGSMTTMSGADGKGLKYTAATTLTTNQFVRAGYTFKGWNTAANGSGKSYTDKASVSKLTTTDGATVTLYAQWTSATYSITYNYNGATTTPSNNATYRTDSAAFTLSNPSRTGYDFSGWTGSNGTTPQTSVTVKTGTTGNLSFKANWTPKVFKVTLNNQSATSAGTAALYEKYATGWYTDSACTSTTSYITVPTKTGYTFGGYYTQTDGNGTQCIKADGTVSAGNTSFSAATTLYAKWTANKYTLTFNANGGSVTESSRKVAYGSTYGSLPTPTKTGYTCSGWYTEKTGGTKVSSTTKMGSANDTVYAHWTANTYTISFNKNSGTGSMSSITATYDKNVKLTSNSFTRKKYEFKNWNTKSDGSGKSYNNGVTVSNLAASGTVTLYAQWTQVQFTADDIGEKATIGVGSNKDIDPGQSITLTAYAPSGYIIKEIGFNPGNSSCTVVSYTIADDGKSVRVTLKNTGSVAIGLTAHSGGEVYEKE